MAGIMKPALNRGTYNKARADELKPRVDAMAPVSYEVADATSAHASEGSAITSTSFVNHDTIKVTFADVKAGDVLDVDCQCYATTTGGTGYLRLGNTALSLASGSIPENTSAAQVRVHGIFTVAADAASLTIYLQGRVSAGSLQTNAGVIMVGRLYRPAA